MGIAVVPPQNLLEKTKHSIEALLLKLARKMWLWLRILTRCQTYRAVG